MALRRWPSTSLISLAPSGSPSQDTGVASVSRNESSDPADADAPPVCEAALARPGAGISTVTRSLEIAFLAFQTAAVQWDRGGAPERDKLPERFASRLSKPISRTNFSKSLLRKRCDQVWSVDQFFVPKRDWVLLLLGLTVTL